MPCETVVTYIFIYLIEIYIFLSITEKLWPDLVLAPAQTRILISLEQIRWEYNL